VAGYRWFLQVHFQYCSTVGVGDRRVTICFPTSDYRLAADSLFSGAFFHSLGRRFFDINHHILVYYMPHDQGIQ